MLRTSGFLLAGALVAVVALGCGVSVETGGSGGSGGAGGSGTGSGHGSGAGTQATGTGAGTSSTGTGAGGTTTTSTGVGGGSSSSSSGAGGGNGCDATTCQAPFMCCGNACIAPYNDVNNCGTCGNVCPGSHPYCDHGSCAMQTPCDGGPVCDPPGFCCGSMCCNEGELCCDVPSGVETGPRCTPPENGTCPRGCPMCL
ncbi:MAG TPA: hypothetical protein VHB21_22520 [Minicystis sp.]|nr:hypothetical protein [Minicystis sp.]